MNDATNQAASLLSTSARPLTGKFTAEQMTMCSMVRPIHGVEHLAQAWSAFAAIARGEAVDANLSFAMTRLEHARVASYKPRQLGKAVIEVASLRAALRAFGINA